MPDLKQSLHDHDHGHLRIVAEHWGIVLTAVDARSALDELTSKMLDVDLVNEILDTLPEKAVQALKAVYEKKGRLPWVHFTRRFGEVREIGPGRRDRERPDLHPISTAEFLWYRALMARAFFNTARGAEEFAYIPADLLDFVAQAFMGKKQPITNHSVQVLGRAATVAERAVPFPADDSILNHTCTLLAALRTGLVPPEFTPVTPEFIKEITSYAGILDPNGIPEPENTRAFLEAPRAEALLALVQTWLHSAELNDLRHVPGLQIEGEWKNDPLQTRNFILRIISRLPEGTWWSLPAFLADIHHHYPDFQRPAGDYDSWFIKDEQTGAYLRGFEHWFDVEGALIRYLITGPLHWLGLTDIACPEESLPATAFKPSKWADRLLEGIPPKGFLEENSLVHIRSDGRVSVPVLAPRAVRYQIARFCSWENGNIHEYRYRLTPSSLTGARESGLRVSHLISLLRRNAESIPPNILTALDRWDKGGTQVRMQGATVLRLASPQILTDLRNSRAARFLGDPLGPATIIVKDGAEEKVLAILVEMGYFGEFTGEN